MKDLKELVKESLARLYCHDDISSIVVQLDLYDQAYEVFVTTKNKKGNSYWRGLYLLGADDLTLKRYEGAIKNG